MKRIFKFAVVWVAVCCAWAQGHPGHGVTPDGTPQHVLLEPVHVLEGVLLAAAVGLGFWIWRKYQRRTPVR